MGSYMIYAGLAVGVAALAAGMFYATNAQLEKIPSTVEAAPATLEGTIPPPDSLGVAINREKWNSDPFADEAAEVKAKLGV